MSELLTIPYGKSEENPTENREFEALPPLNLQEVGTAAVKPLVEITMGKPKENGDEKDRPLGDREEDVGPDPSKESPNGDRK